MKRGFKKGTILIGNVIFIVLNLIFITILIVFLWSKMTNAAVLEEVAAKQIALMIDSAKPGMKMHLNMERAIEKAKKELGEDKIDEIVKINDNIVTVKLRDNGEYSYSFFNDIDASAYLDKTNNKEYVFVINEKNEYND